MSNRVAMPRYRHIPQREIDMTIIADGNSSVAATVSPHEMETRNSKRRRSTGEVVNENSNFSEQDSEYENIPNTKLSENNGDHNTNHAAEQEEENEMVSYIRLMNYQIFNILYKPWLDLHMLLTDF